MQRCTVVAASAWCLAFLVGCEAPKPAAEPKLPKIGCVADPKPKSPERVEIPSVVLNLNGIDCLLWNPQLDQKQAFYGVVHADDEEDVVPLEVSDGSYATITEYLALNGKPWSRSFKDLAGWIAVCRTGKAT